MALLLAPFVWVAAEWGRGHLFGGFPWGLLGYSQYAQLPAIQIAELGGVYAVSFVVLATNAAVAGAVVLPWRRAVTGLVLALVLFGGPALCVLILGLIALRVVPGRSQDISIHREAQLQ